MRRRRINLILNEGTPFGLRTAELSNWNGKVIVCPRGSMKELKLLPESQLPAIYFLIGENTEMYIGETDALSQRLANHAYTKDFWTDLIALTSPEFSKTEVKYLEAILVERLQNEKRVQLLNSTAPKSPTISPAIQDSLDDYIDLAADVLLSIGFDFMAPSRESQQQLESGIEVTCVGPGAKGVGVWSTSGLLVRSGTLTRAEYTPTIPSSAKKRIEEAVQTGLLVKQSDESYVLMQDVLFTSASSAAAFVLARSANGLSEWKTAEGVTLKELE